MPVATRLDTILPSSCPWVPGTASWLCCVFPAPRSHPPPRSSQPCSPTERRPFLSHLEPKKDWTSDLACQYSQRPAFASGSDGRECTESSAPVLPDPRTGAETGNQPEVAAVSMKVLSELLKQGCPRDGWSLWESHSPHPPLSAQRHQPARKPEPSVLLTQLFWGTGPLLRTKPEVDQSGGSSHLPQRLAPDITQGPAGAGREAELGSQAGHHQLRPEFQGFCTQRNWSLLPM